MFQDAGCWSTSRCLCRLCGFATGGWPKGAENAPTPTQAAGQSAPTPTQGAEQSATHGATMYRLRELPGTPRESPLAELLEHRQRLKANRQRLVEVKVVMYGKADEGIAHEQDEHADEDGAPARRLLGGAAPVATSTATHGCSVAGTGTAATLGFGSTCRRRPPRGRCAHTAVPFDSGMLIFGGRKPLEAHTLHQI